MYRAFHTDERENNCGWCHTLKAIENSEFDKSAVLNQCFDCLVSLGLESTTMRSITNATGLKSSSLYYWFKNKDEIISEATNYGLRQIIDDLFTRAYEHLNNLDFLFKQFPSVIIEYKSKLRIIYQVLTSPQYGERLRESCSDLSLAYASYGRVLSDRMGCDYKKLVPYVQLSISAITNFILWEDDAKLRSQLSEIHSQVKKLVSGN